MFPEDLNQGQFSDHATYHLDRAAAMVRSAGGVPEVVLEVPLLAHAAGDHLWAAAAGYKKAQAYMAEHSSEIPEIPPETLAKLKAEHERLKQEAQQREEGQWEEGGSK